MLGLSLPFLGEMLIGFPPYEIVVLHFGLLSIRFFFNSSDDLLDNGQQGILSGTVYHFSQVRLMSFNWEYTWLALIHGGHLSPRYVNRWIRRRIFPA